MERRVLQKGARIRVLVVDDSVVIRRLVTLALGEDPQIEVVGAAADGAIALSMIPQVAPAVVTLDIEMPVMDGLETLRRIRRDHPHLCTIMFSSLTQQGAAATMEALALGADDYAAKAANTGSLDQSLASLRAELVPKIKQFFTWQDGARPSVPAARAPLAAPARAERPRTSGVLQKRQIVAIGVSTGGPIALSTVLATLPVGFPVPIVIVQHMPPVFTRLLAERLNAQCLLAVEEAAEGTQLAPGKVVIGRGDYHMQLRRKGLQIEVHLDQSSPENSCRPAVDVLFRSVADVYGGGVVAAVLTGMGQDGLRGVEVLKTQGAYVIAQDEASSVVWGMPGLVATAGLADAVIPLDTIAGALIKQVT